MSLLVLLQSMAQGQDNNVVIDTPMLGVRTKERWSIAHPDEDEVVKDL